MSYKLHNNATWEEITWAIAFTFVTKINYLWRNYNMWDICGANTSLNNDPPQYIHHKVLIIRPYEYVTFLYIKDFSDVIKLNILRCGGYPGLV